MIWVNLVYSPIENLDGLMPPLYVKEAPYIHLYLLLGLPLPLSLDTSVE
jgi:hypothetical protein